MLTLLGPQAESAVGLDLSQQMLNIARSHVAEAGLERCELRHGDIFGTRLPDGQRRPRGRPPGAALPGRSGRGGGARRPGWSRPAAG